MAPQGPETTSQHSPAKNQQLPISAEHSSHKSEPEIVTITQENGSLVSSFSQAGASPRHTLPSTPGSAAKKVQLGQDKLLKKLTGKSKGGTTVLWLPGSGRHVSEGGPDAYRSFTRIVRTLHLDDAITVCSRWRIEPKQVITFSSIDSRQLPPSHPCAALRVLWFSAKLDDVEGQDNDSSDWYGNVEFAVDARVLLEQWKYSFLVEMMTTPTHTTSRILLTNTDYSDTLTPYDRHRAGGPWQVAPDGSQRALVNCSRYRFKGINHHEHVLEFMLDVKYEDEVQILKQCEISFKNHEDAEDMTVRHVCNRYQRAGTKCPTPYTCARTAHLFFEGLQRQNICCKTGIPKLSASAQLYLQEYNSKLMEGLAQNFSMLTLPYYVHYVGENWCDNW